MIRINLGKGAYEEKSELSKKLAGLHVPPKVLNRIQKLTADIGVIVTIVVAVAISLLFPLVAKQYRLQMIADHDARMKQMSDKLVAANNEISKYNHYKAELESYNNQKTLVTNRLGVVKQLLDQRGTPVNVLDTVGQSLPARSWYSSIELQLSGDTPSLALAGASYSNEEVSDLVEKLGESVYLNDVSLDEVSTRVEDKVEVRTFIITAKPKTKQIVGSGSPAVATAPESGEKKN